MSPTSDELKAQREEATGVVTAAIRKAAEMLTLESDEMRKRFPAMSRQPESLRLRAESLREFIASPEYRQAIDAYVAGSAELTFLEWLAGVLDRVAGRAGLPGATRT